MKMKKLIMFLLMSVALPLSMMAQDDDMYYVPTKENKAKEAESYGMPTRTYYAGSTRSVDEYNRRMMVGANQTDSVGNDIIDFSAVRGVYPDSVYNESDSDYELTRRMTRFDDYTPSQADGHHLGHGATPVCIGMTIGTGTTRGYGTARGTGAIPIILATIPGTQAIMATMAIAIILGIGVAIMVDTMVTIMVVVM